MNITSSSSTFHRDAPTASAMGPLLARLPDVTACLPKYSETDNRLTAAGALDYRFDPPQPDVLHRAGQNERRSRAAGERSPLLPRSDPFSPPTNSLLDLMAPIARFATLVFLFTVAGTIILRSGKTDRDAVDVLPDPSANAVPQQSLEPATTLGTAPAVARQSAAVPTATGPLGASLVPGADPPQSSTTAAIDLLPSLPEPAAEVQRHGEGATDQAPTDSAESSIEISSLPLTRADRRTLPEVRALDAPPAAARFTGQIFAAPPRHASHDDNQPSVY